MVNVSWYSYRLFVSYGYRAYQIQMKNRKEKRERYKKKCERKSECERNKIESIVGIEMVGGWNRMRKKQEKLSIFFELFIKRRSIFIGVSPIQYALYYILRGFITLNSESFYCK